MLFRARPEAHCSTCCPGTVADVAPLANRPAIVRYGVDLIKKGPRVGMSALPMSLVRHRTNFLPEIWLSSRHQCAGRLMMTRGLRLPSVRTPLQPGNWPRSRRTEQGERFRPVDQLWPTEPTQGFEKLRLSSADDEWHPGVVASRWANCRPVSQTSHRSADGGVWRSARSTQDVNIKAARSLRRSIDAYGGHVAQRDAQPEELESVRAELCRPSRGYEGHRLPALKIDAEAVRETLVCSRRARRSGTLRHMNPQQSRKPQDVCRRGFCGEDIEAVL